MKIIFVRPNINNRFMIVPPLGLGYLATAAKKAGHEVVIWDAWLLDKLPLTAFANVAMLRPDVIGIQVFYDTIEWVRSFIYYLRSSWADTKVIVGGPEITAHPELTKELGADEGIIGEGEFEFYPNADGAEEGRFDVNSIPMPDWDSIDLPAYWSYMNSVTMPTRVNDQQRYSVVVDVLIIAHSAQAI